MALSLGYLQRDNSFKKDSRECETPRIRNNPVNMYLEKTLSFKDLVNQGNNYNKEDNSGVKTRRGINLRGPKPDNMILERSLSFTSLVQVGGEDDDDERGSSPKRRNRGKMGNLTALSLPAPTPFWSPRPSTELDAAAVTLQKVYKSYRTRRNLADCAVVVEELWWKELELATSEPYKTSEKPESAVSRWARAGTKAAKVGKGLLKDDKAQKLALRHWLEAIDPRHRYGHNLHLYYDVWSASESTQPFFFWLDIGDGKEVNLIKCPRTLLQRQCITYLGPKERQAYEVVVENGKLVNKQTKNIVETIEGTKWIFVLSTTRRLYIGQKQKGRFQHSSFLSGAAITAAGRIVSQGGVVKAVWPYSGHYLPTEENFREFISFLRENNVDLTNVKMNAIDDDNHLVTNDGSTKPSKVVVTKSDGSDEKKRFSCKWSTGNGPRIGCVRDYPIDLQTRALEQVNLSPRVVKGTTGLFGPIPSPRPSPKIRVSPRLSCMGLPSPRN
ncbi:PREDICTED: IQ domain-containing protein IQM5 [Camelina sativa]|uniref:IQ domain-containing protein IQM5 n=1 Tax=Camelina sativa TaxID=90675 RepID=A0ABM0XAT0_CAMSA|nr:PREDICTED: IQ domain-containing protein IQM5 [Camelina sativa]